MPNPPEYPISIGNSVAELVWTLGCVDVARIRIKPPPGTVTEELFAALPSSPRCELVDGVAVAIPRRVLHDIYPPCLKKRIEFWSSQCAIELVAIAEPLIRIREGLVRSASLACFSGLSSKDSGHSTAAWVSLAPILAVEFCVDEVRPEEHRRKTSEFFEAGAESVWIIDVALKTIEVWDSPKSMRIYDCNDTITGTLTLQGFELNVGHWFQESHEQYQPKRVIPVKS